MSFPRLIRERVRGQMKHWLSLSLKDNGAEMSQAPADRTPPIIRGSMPHQS